MQRPLGERREGAHLLDLVPEQLDPQRLPAGGGEDVDDPPADGELAPLLDPVDPLVAGARQRPGETLEARLVAARETHRLWSLFVGRNPLGQCRRRRADEPARREDVERPGALADEMRWRFEPRGVRDASAREKRHPLRTEEPGRTVGRVPCIGVLREQHEQPSSELLVQGRKHERQRRLRDPRASRQRLRERLEPFAGGELRNEGVKGCLVHANGGEQAPRAHPSVAPARHSNLPQGALSCPWTHASSTVVQSVCRVCASFVTFAPQSPATHFRGGFSRRP